MLTADLFLCTAYIYCHLYAFCHSLAFTSSTIHYAHSIENMFCVFFSLYVVVNYNKEMSFVLEKAAGRNEWDRIEWFCWYHPELTSVEVQKM